MSWGAAEQFNGSQNNARGYEGAELTNQQSIQRQHRRGLSAGYEPDDRQQQTSTSGNAGAAAAENNTLRIGTNQTAGVDTALTVGSVAKRGVEVVVSSTGRLWEWSFLAPL